MEDNELRFQDGVRTLFAKDKVVAFYPNGNIRQATPKEMPFSNITRINWPLPLI